MKITVNDISLWIEYYKDELRWKSTNETLKEYLKSYGENMKQAYEWEVEMLKDF